MYALKGRNAEAVDQSGYLFAVFAHRAAQCRVRFIACKVIDAENRANRNVNTAVKV